jgi:hypothetical protein
LTSDGQSLIGLAGNELFGLQLEGSVDDIKIIDKTNLSTDLPSAASP